MKNLIVTIDPQPTLTAVCVFHKKSRKMTLYKQPFIPKKGKMHLDKILLSWLNKSPYKIHQHYDHVFRQIEEDNIGNTFDEIIVEGQFKGKAMIGLECFLKGWISHAYPESSLTSISALSWKKVLFYLGYVDTPHIPKGKKTYEQLVWNDIVKNYENISICDFCPIDLAKKNDDIVDAYLMMKFAESKGLFLESKDF